MNPAHVIPLLRRKVGMSIPDFLDYWENTHLRETGATKLEKLPYFWYHQNHVVTDPDEARFSTSDYDGWTDLYFESLEHWHSMRSSARTQGSASDEENFLAGPPQWFVGRDAVLLDGDPDTPGLLKVLRLFRRRYDLRLPEFVRRWSEEYAPGVLRDAPGLVRYVQVPLVETAYLDAVPRWDGIDIAWVNGVSEELFDVLGRGLDDFVDEAEPPVLVTRPMIPDYFAHIVAASVPSELAGAAQSAS